MDKIPQFSLTAVDMASDISNDIFGRISGKGLTNWQKYVILHEVMKDLYPKMLDYYAEAQK